MYQVTSPFWEFVDHWQTLIAGGLAVCAAFVTVYFTVQAAKLEVDAAQEQIKTTVDLERARSRAEKLAFLTMLSATVETIIGDINAARTLFGETPSNNDYTQEAYLARQRIKKTAFGDIRSALVRLGGRYAVGFVQLENEIDHVSTDWQEFQGVSGGRFLKGRNLGLLEQLDKIENLTVAILVASKLEMGELGRD